MSLGEGNEWRSRYPKVEGVEGEFPCSISLTK